MVMIDVARHLMTDVVLPVATDVLIWPALAFIAFALLVMLLDGLTFLRWRFI